MHWGSASKVKSSHLEDPSRRIPGPASNRVVDDGCPDEHEDNARKHAATFSNSTDCKSYCDGCEHALVDSKHKIGDLRRSNRWCSEDISEAKVFQVTNVFAGSVGEGERITPEEPLEGDHSRGHNREPDERQGGLPPSETGIEEAAETKSAAVAPDAHVFVYALTRHRES
jgi:hypothetical protein